jgi:hypothetical protein
MAHQTPDIDVHVVDGAAPPPPVYETERVPPRPVGPVRGFTRGVSSVMADALDLGELQMRLVKADAKAAVGKVKGAVIGVVVAVGLLLAALPVLGLGLASFLAWALEWPLWTTELLVGLLFVVIAGIVAWQCMKAMRNSLNTFSNSQREAAANLQWLRQALSDGVSGD